MPKFDTTIQPNPLQQLGRGKRCESTRGGFIEQAHAWARLAATGLLLLIAPSSIAAEIATDYQAGVHYEELPVAVPTATGDKLEVVEVFSYMCVHCFNFDAPVSVWADRQPSDVAFRREPAIFNKTWELLAQSFYTAEALGVADKTHDRIFEAIHTHNQNLADPAKMAALFKQFAGTSEADFKQAYESFSVRSKVQQAKTKGRQYRVSAVPSVIVAGKYKVDGRMAGSNTSMLKVVNFLLEKERAAQGAPQVDTADTP